MSVLIALLQALVLFAVAPLLSGVTRVARAVFGVPVSSVTTHWRSSTGFAVKTSWIAP